MEIYHIPYLKRDNLSMHVDGILQSTVTRLTNGALLLYNVKLSLWEVFTNFICHGNEHSCKDITVTIEEEQNKITIKVTSASNYFEWDSYKGMECPGIKQLRGRGLFILQQICQHFSYEENGQVAKMVFKKESEIEC